MSRNTKSRKNRKVRPEPNPAATGPFAGMFFAARTAAVRLGLFLLAEGNPKAPSWRFYDRKSGRAIFSYLPHSFMVSLGKELIHCASWRDAVAVALQRRDAGRFIDA